MGERHCKSSEAEQAVVAADVEDNVLRSSRNQLRRVALAWVSWGYLLGSVGLWLLIRYAAERWWLATLLMFGPRWIWLSLGALLTPAVAWWGRRLERVAVVTAIIITIGPVMGLCIPWETWLHSAARNATANSSPLHLRILTCNVHGEALQRPAMNDLIADVQPDVVALQEFNPSPISIVPPMSGLAYMAHDGELCVLSRFPIFKSQRVVRDEQIYPSVWIYGIGTEFVIQTPSGAVTFIAVHLASPHYAFSAALRQDSGGRFSVRANSNLRAFQAEQIADAVRENAQALKGMAGAVIIAGDFNTPCESVIWRRTLSDLTDAFGEAGWGFGWSYYHRGAAVRIDHIACSAGWTVKKSWVERSVGSPHQPVVADLQWTENSP